MVNAGNEAIWFSHDITRKKTSHYILHHHERYECFYIISGDVQYLVDGIIYTPAPHSLLLLAGGVFHGYKVNSREPYERYTLHFNKSLLPTEMRDYFLAPFHATQIYHPDVGSYRVLQFLASVEDCCTMPQSLKSFSLALRSLAFLSQLANMRGVLPPTMQGESHGMTLEQRIVEYIDTHITESLTSEKIARHFYISKSQLYRRFTEATGTTVSAYTRNKRVAIARQLIQEGLSASQAAMSAGFNDYSTYYRTRIRIEEGESVSVH